MMKETPNVQSLSAKKAETQRAFYGRQILEQGYGAEFRRRADLALADFETLKDRVSFSPFLEIGAGGAQRSAVLMDRYSAVGVATDISQNVLQNAPYIFTVLGYRRDPMLVCCDAHYLPFLPHSFQFVFAYRTLHHCDNPVPVVAECYRVLGKGGHLFFNEEPMDTPLRRLLRGNRTLSHPPQRLQKLAYKLGVEKVFWDDGDYERSIGITEARFDIGLWRETLKPFAQTSIIVNRKLRIRSDLQKPALNSFLSGVIGGNIRGLCRKTEGEPVSGDFRKRLMCLDCTSPRLLRIEDDQLGCQNCGRSYPIINGIIRLLPRDLEDYLYFGSSTPGDRVRCC